MHSFHKRAHYTDLQNKILGATRKSSTQAHDQATDVEDQNSEAFTATSDSDNDSLMKPVFATSENNATKSIVACQERGGMHVNSINSTNPCPEYNEIP